MQVVPLPFIEDGDFVLKNSLKKLLASVEEKNFRHELLLKEFLRVYIFKNKKRML